MGKRESEQRWRPWGSAAPGPAADWLAGWPALSRRVREQGGRGKGISICKLKRGPSGVFFGGGGAAVDEAIGRPQTTYTHKHPWQQGGRGRDGRRERGRERQAHTRRGKERERAAREGEGGATRRPKTEAQGQTKQKLLFPQYIYRPERKQNNKQAMRVRVLVSLVCVWVLKVLTPLPAAHFQRSNGPVSPIHPLPLDTLDTGLCPPLCNARI